MTPDGLVREAAGKLTLGAPPACGFDPALPGGAAFLWDRGGPSEIDSRNPLGIREACVRAF